MKSQTPQERIMQYLTDLYGKDQSISIHERLIDRLKVYQGKVAGERHSPIQTLEELDAILITYGDQFQSPGKTHLTTLAEFIEEYLQGLISTIHLLPFFPYSSDDGFSVIDYQAVDPQLGDWKEIQALKNCCILMFDAVINHISSQSSWFQDYLKNKSPYRDYFIEVEPGTDLSQVTRPRAKPLLSEFETQSGKKYLWTTFSPDQIDLNFKNPDLLLDILDLLLFYVQQGAEIIRLDAIAFLWKEIGTNCIHLPQTHQVVKLIRAVLDEYAPGVIIITETNVPHLENISYFGKQITSGDKEQALGDEAQMVYQFPLAPLVLHTFQTGSAEKLTRWAASLEIPFESAAFLNFIASHDGIGVRPAEGILTLQEIQGLVDQTLQHGGQVSYKTDPDGTESVYELNITLYDWLNHPGETDSEIGLKRFLASQAIMISLSGVPGIYVHSLFGSPNYLEGLAETGRARTINREKINLSDLNNQLNDPGSRTNRVFNSYSHLLRVRQAHSAFKPLAGQQILDLNERVFSLLRISQEGEEKVLVIINISDESFRIDLDPSLFTSPFMEDLITGTEFTSKSIALAPYQVLWLV
jgi:sucrose phosphorylase